MRQLAKIPLRGIDTRPLDRQAPAGLCEDIVNLRPDGPVDAPYWVPVRGSVSASDIGLGEYFGIATAIVDITTQPRSGPATVRLTYDGQTYSSAYPGTIGSAVIILAKILSAICVTNSLPFRVAPRNGDLVFVANTAGDDLNGQTVIVSGSTGATFTTGVFTGGVDPSDLANVPGAYQSRAAFYFEKKDGIRQVLSLDNSGLRIYGLDGDNNEVNAQSVTTDYVPVTATVMSAAQLDDIIAVGLSEDDVPKELTYLMDGKQISMKPPSLPEVECTVSKVYPNDYSGGLEPGWYGVRMGWRLTDGNVVALTPPSVIQLKKIKLGLTGEDAQKYYTYHLSFRVPAMPELGDWKDLVTGVAVYLSPRADVSTADIPPEDNDPNQGGGGGGGNSNVSGNAVTYTEFVAGQSYSAVAYRVRAVSERCIVRFLGRKIENEQSLGEDFAPGLYPMNAVPSDLKGFFTINESGTTTVEGESVRLVTITIPWAEKVTKVLQDGDYETTTLGVTGLFVFNRINTSTHLRATRGEFWPIANAEGFQYYTLDKIKGYGETGHPGTGTDGTWKSMDVDPSSTTNPNDPTEPVDEEDYQVILSGKEQTLANALYYDIGSIPFTTSRLHFKETEEILITNLISQEDNVVNLHRVKAAIVTSYNKQLVLGNTEIDFANPSPNRLTIINEDGESPSGEMTTASVSYAVKISANGKVYYRQGEAFTVELYAGRLRDSIICYPDRRATELKLTVDGTPRRFRLSASKRNNFAYAVISGSAPLSEQGLSGDFEGEVDYTKGDHAPNRVMVSETFNPHVFLAKRVIYGDNQFYDAIRGFGVNALPVASGQFGTYPMYVLCKNSVWALEQGSDPDVAFARKAPVSVSHGLVHPYAICNMGQAIAFASANGVHLISGGRMDHVSDPVDDYLLTTPERIRLGYFDKDGRRELWCATEGNVFVWSTEYRLWYRLERNRIHFFSDGRNLLSVDDKGLIVDESKGGTTSLPWRVRTRPIHWGEPNMMKRVFRMAFRHSFATEPSKQITADSNINPMYEGDSPGYFAIKYGSLENMTIFAEGVGDTSNYLHTIDLEYEPRYPHRYRS